MTFRKFDIVEEEIGWYLHWSAADCGFRSNWGAMCSAAIWNGGKWQDNYDAAFFEAVNKRRLIENKLKQLSYHHQNILYTSFGVTPIPAIVSKFFRRYAPAALHSKLIQPEELISLCNRHYQNGTSEQQKLFLKQIEDIAVKDMTEAIDQYWSLRERKRNKPAT